MIDSLRNLSRQRLKETREQQEKLLQLQNDQVSLSPLYKEGSLEKIMGLDLSTWEDHSCRQQERSLQNLSSHDKTVKEREEHVKSEEKPSHTQTEVPASIQTSSVVVRERSQTLEEPSQKTTRAKRESRRMRELEQAKFSLELLKVRATGGGASSPSEEHRWSVELVPSTPPLCSPQGTPDSQSSKGSFELLDLEEEPPKAIEEVIDCSPPPSIAPETNMEVVSTNLELVRPYSTEVSHVSQNKRDLAALSPTTHPPKIENYLSTFYAPNREGSTVITSQPAEETLQNTEAAIFTTTTTVTKPNREKRESTRRPVVVVISMQKETALSEHLGNSLVEVRDAAAQTGEVTPSPQKSDPAPLLPEPVPIPNCAPLADQAIIAKLVRLNEEKQERQRNRQQQNEKEMMEQIRQQKEVLERQRLFFVQHERDMFEKQRGEALHRIQQSRHSVKDNDRTVTAGKPLRPSSLLVERTAGLAPHARTQSDSSPPRVDIQDRTHHPQLPPPPASAARERYRPIAEGWAPKLTLESKDGGASRVRTANMKLSSNQGTTVSVTDKSGNIFFSPKDKVTFAK